MSGVESEDTYIQYIYIYSIQISVCGGGQPVHVNAALLFSRREHFISSTGVAI